MDIIGYAGNSTIRTLNHNLGVAPELIIVKTLSNSRPWMIYHSTTGATKYLTFASAGGAASTDSTVWNNTSPTSLVFTIGTANEVNATSENFIAYMFATLAGISKVGSYTGTGTTKQINCGFTSGARFVMIKRTDSTGGWYIWDTARGIIAGNDPYLFMNDTPAEVTNTDYIDPYSAGFELSSTAPAAINANGGTYIYLAIA